MPRETLEDFETWCRRRRRRPLPATPATVADYLARLADGGSKPSTIERRVSAIAKAHKALAEQAAR